jgi:uncharacterized membrane protein
MSEVKKASRKRLHEMKKALPLPFSSTAQKKQKNNLYATDERRREKK